MYSYFLGCVTEVNTGNIVIECGGVGYLIRVPNPFSYTVDETYKIYVYNYIREEEYSLYGFKEKSEYELFIKLISVKGLGPKTALPILATGSLAGIADAIDRENILYLTKFPKIGEKLARQIILDLKGKVELSKDALENDDTIDDLISALVCLGYKTSEIKKVIPLLNRSETLENQVKEALKMLLK
ncbi:MAG: Holliday junction branch migration protein RuvA [Bacilli bacterium]